MSPLLTIIIFCVLIPFFQQVSTEQVIEENQICGQLGEGSSTVHGANICVVYLLISDKEPGTEWQTVPANVGPGLTKVSQGTYNNQLMSRQKQSSATDSV